MKTLFDQAVREELLQRIQLLNENSKANWGKMNVFQMVKHCNIWNEWVLGRGFFTDYEYRQDLLGKIFGKWALRSNTKDEQVIGKNMPAGKMFLTKDTNGDLETEKALWLRFIGEYEHFSNPNFIHDFFGKMSDEQIGMFAYKHFDHHLRQFGV